MAKKKEENILEEEKIDKTKKVKEAKEEKNKNDKKEAKKAVKDKKEEIKVEEKLDEKVNATKKTTKKAEKKENEKEEIKENKEDANITDSEKVNNIIKKAKESGKITYGELATQLDDANPEQIDKVFDAFEEMGIDLSKEELDDEEPDVEDLKEVEELKLDEITDTDYEGINVDDPVRMYLR